jgi:signal transduction histidine kinase
VDHLNRGAVLLVDDDERRALLDLDARAAAKARPAGAYRAAMEYLRQAIELLPAVLSDDEHDRAQQLYRDAAEMAFVAASADEADALVEVALGCARTRLEKARLYIAQVVGHTYRLDAARSIRAGADGLRLFGLDLAVPDPAPTVAALEAEVEACLEGRSLDDLRDARPGEDPEQVALQTLLLELQPPLRFTDIPRTAMTVLWMVRSVLLHGLTPIAAPAYANFSIQLCAQERFSRARDFGRLALELSRRAGAFEAPVLFIGGATQQWWAPLRDTLPLLQDVAVRGLASGALNWAAYGRTMFVRHLWALGTDLARIVPVIDDALALTRRIGSRSAWAALVTHRQSIRALQGRTERGRFDDADFDETSFLASSRSDPYSRAYYALGRLQVSYLLGDIEGALAWSEEAARLTAFFVTSIERVAYVMFTALALVAAAERREGAERERLAARIAPFEEQLRHWAEACPPDTFRHKHELVLAEIERRAGGDAERLYHRAIEGAASGGFLQDEALAEELCGRCYLSRGQRHVAAHYFGAALGTYARWGAVGKVDALEEELGRLGLPVIRRAAPTIAPAAERAGLDLLTVFKAAETLAGEVILERLLEKMMRIVVEAAGAQRGVLVLEDSDGTMEVRASASAEGALSLAVSPLSRSPDVPASLVEHVWRSGEILVLDDAAQEGSFTGDPTVASRSLKSVLAVPIRRQARSIGVLYFENDLATGVFQPERVRLFGLLSTAIAIALENSMLFEERARAEATMRFLAEASAALVESLDYHDTVNKIAGLVVPFLGDACVVDSAETEGIRRVASRHVDPAKQAALDQLAALYPAAWDSAQPAARALRSGEPVFLADASDPVIDAYSRDAENARLIRQVGVRSAMAVPLVARGRTLGTITFVYADSGRRYTRADLSTAQELTRRAALAIDNTRLFDESQRLYRESQDAVRMRDEFLGLASHELRTPLTSMRLSLETSMRRPDPASTEDTRRTLSMMSRQVDRLARLVDELTTISGIQERGVTLEFDDVDLREIVREVVARFAVQIERGGGRVDLHAPASVAGRWDRRRLAEVATNLIDNAVKFGPGKPIEIGVEENAGTARLVVTDHGIGIPAERLPHIFDRFVRGVSATHYGGLGLGLFIVREVVEALGGRVWAESRPGNETTFTVELPEKPRFERAASPA